MRKSFVWRIALAWWVAVAALPCTLRAAEGGSLVGAIYVETEPAGVQIFVAGELRGVSPCGIPDVGIGMVEVTGKKQGYVEIKKVVQVEPDEIGLVQMKLEKAVNVGSLVVLVQPTGGEIQLDRVPRGKSPMRIINVKAGTHSLVVSLQGHNPMYVKVTVVAGQDHVVKGKLARASGIVRLPGKFNAKDLELNLEEEGAGKGDKVPSPDEMPEEKAFEPVRALMRERDYDAALKLLDAMASGEDGQKYADRIARDRGFVRDMKKVFEAARTVLKGKEGERYELALRNGVTITGKIIEVGKDALIVDFGGSGKGKPIPLKDLHPDRTVRLAALARDRSVTQARCAVFLAAEGAFKSALRALKLAAGQGQNVSAIKSYLDSERLWAAALAKEKEQKARRKKEEAEKARKAAKKAAAGKKTEAKGEDEEETGPPLVLVDRGRGAALSGTLLHRISSAGLAHKDRYTHIALEDLEGAKLLVISDPGTMRTVDQYDHDEVRMIVDFVRRGRGLVFFGAYRASDSRGRRKKSENPFNALLRSFGFQVKAERLQVSDRAPKGFSKYEAQCFPIRKHPVTYRVRKAVFGIYCPSLAVKQRKWGLMKAGEFYSSQASGQSPLMVAAAVVGKGRVVVFASMPKFWTSDDEGSVRYQNDAERMVVNAIRWAAFLKRK